MGGEGRETHQKNKKMHEALIEVRDEVGDKRWRVTGKPNGYIGLSNESLNTNRQLILDFEEKAGMKIENWELENSITWKDSRTESAIDYIIIII